ncbi:MAG: PQQ-like beta-propeller repeat protein [Planctomycetia bacterium]|nr:PQQ-like beta-propeller repeat protein [Planctomycetia bacterium]
MTWVDVGLHPAIWNWCIGVLGGVALLVGLAARSGPRKSHTLWSAHRVWASGVAWSLAAGVVWYVLCSPFSRDVSIAAGYTIATWWLLWVWMMFFVSWRWTKRLSLWAVFLAAAALFLSSVKSDGWDGAGRPNIVWRFPTMAAPGVAAEVEAPLVPSRSDKPERDETADYPCFRGVDGLATVRAAKLARNWTEQQPALRWRHSVGAGWSGFVVAAGRVFTQEQRGEEECVVCYDRHTGGELWVHRDAAHYQNSGAGDGPRATPTIHGQCIFALGSTGILNCLDCSNGMRHWTINILTDNEAQAPGHGMTGSPLVAGDLVVVCAGGARGASLVAYDKTSGKRAWRAGNDPAGYASPSLVQLAGFPQVLIINSRNLNAHDPQTGEILWSFPWRNDQATNCSQPFPVGDKGVFVSADYGAGCALLEITQGAPGKWNVKPRWSNRGLQTKFCSVVVHDGYAYSFDDEILECVSVADGRRQWKRGRYGHGQLLLADDLLVIQAEDGRVALVEATPEKHRELGAFQALEGKTWNNPALAGRQLFVRNDHERACYQLPGN